MSAARKGRPAILVPNPFYAAYAAGADAADSESVYLPATADNGFLPDLDALVDDLLARTVVFYLASPSNPQGAVADGAYLARLVALARRFGFLIFADECYSEIYSTQKPAGTLEHAGPGFRQCRDLPFALEALEPAGPARRLRRRRQAISCRASSNCATSSAPQVPVPLQEVAIAAYTDEAHVEENRRLYSAKFDLADQIIGDRYGYKRPAGGFFLWLDVSAYGGSDEGRAEAVARGRLARPARRLCRAHSAPTDPIPARNISASPWCRISEITAEALHRLVAVLG